MDRPACLFRADTMHVTSVAVRFGARTVPLDEIRSFRVTRGSTTPTLACAAAGVVAWAAGAWMPASALLAVGGLVLWAQQTTHVLRVRDARREHAVLRSPDPLLVRAASRALGDALLHWRGAGAAATMSPLLGVTELTQARNRRAEAEALVLGTGDTRAIEILARACRQPGSYARTLFTAASDEHPVLWQALAVLAGVHEPGFDDASVADLLARAQHAIDLDRGEVISVPPDDAWASDALVTEALAGLPSTQPPFAEGPDTLPMAHVAERRPA